MRRKPLFLDQFIMERNMYINPNYRGDNGHYLSRFP